MAARPWPQDHGPWNSWSRVPYITNIRTGKPSIIPQDRSIHGNFILANYYSHGPLDHDDDSAYYEVYDNFCAYGMFGFRHRCNLRRSNAASATLCTAHVAAVPHTYKCAPELRNGSLAPVVSP